MYNPQVEAISPTLPSEDKDEKSFKTCKDEILQQINNMDREIAKIDAQIFKLKRTKQKLEDEAKKPPEEKASTPEPNIDLRNHSIAQIIYAENRVGWVSLVSRVYHIVWMPSFMDIDFSFCRKRQKLPTLS